MPYRVKDMKELEEKLDEAGSNLVVIDFTAKWCGPCKEMAPKLDKLAAEFDDVVFLKVDVDECEEVVTEYKIDGLPFFTLLKKRKKLGTLTGAHLGKLRALITKHR